MVPCDSEELIGFLYKKCDFLQMQVVSGLTCLEKEM